MSGIINPAAKRPATLANVVAALENAEVVLGLKLARGSLRSERYVKFSDESPWVNIFHTSAGAKLRLQFERKGFRPVSRAKLADALDAADIPIRGTQQ